MMTSVGDAAQIRAIVEQVVEAAITKVTADHPELKDARLPPPIKWMAGIIASLFTLGVAGMAFWLVSSVSTMQITLGRMDERLANNGTTQEARFTDLERRLGQLEAHSGEVKK